MLAALLLTVAGCYPQDEIRSYTVDKVAEVEPAADTQGEQQRMLAAIMLRDREAWFFKLTGPVEQVANVQEEVRSVVESVTFNAGGPPQWNAPAEWRRLPGTSFRYATLQIPIGEESPPLELAISSLPMATDDTASYLLDNVNRWRGQLGQLPLTAGELPAAVEQFEVAGVPTTWVDIVGTSQGNAMGAPFMSGNAGSPPLAEALTPQPEATQVDDPPAQVQPQPVGPQPVGPQPIGPAPVRPTVPAAGGSGDITFETPAGWTEKPGGGFRKLAFDIEGSAGTGELTLIQLGPSPGSVLDNINRWRGQVKLGPIGADELNTQVKELPVGDEQGQVVELIGPEQGILGAIISRPDSTWFVKLQGDAELAKAEREKFEAFLKSLKIK